jgi:hypothetical protein
MMTNGTGLPYQQQSMNNSMMNMTTNSGQAMQNPGIMNTSMPMNGAMNIPMNASMMMNGAVNFGSTMNNGMYNNYGMGNHTGGGSAMMMQHGMGHPGGMVMNVMPGGNSTNRISTNFDGKSQQTTKPDPFANLGL